MTRDEWATKIHKAVIGCPFIIWEDLSEKEKEQWRKAADILLEEQKRLIFIEEILIELNQHLHPFGSIGEIIGWYKVAHEAFIEQDALLRKENPKLPKFYGMPVTGIRKTIEYIKNKTRKKYNKKIRKLKKQIYNL